MARIRDGGGRRVRRRRSYQNVGDHGKDYYDDGDSEGESLYSDSDGLEYQHRETVLDDALFQFFRKQAVKSLKRNFSDFCKDVSTSNKEAILKFNVVPNEVLVRTSFLGAAKASRGRNLACKNNRLFFPIVDSNHWFVFAVDFEFKLFAFLDSYHDKDSSFHLRIKDTLVDNFIHLWELIISQEHDFVSFKVMYPHVPKQKTLVDCGVFCMKYMEIWKPFLDLRTLFSFADILNIRIQYANKLYFHSDNDSDQTLVIDFYK